MIIEYPPSVVAFLQEVDSLRAHRDRLAEQNATAKEVWEKQNQELRASEFRNERLQIEIDRLTARNDSQSRIVNRLVAKVETMALVMATQVNEIKDEIERAQFAPPKSEPKDLPPDVKFVRPTHTPLNVSEIEVMEIEEDVDAERIGQQFGAGFPEDIEKELGRINGHHQPVETSLFPDNLPRDRDGKVMLRDLGAEMGMPPIDQRRYDTKKDQYLEALAPRTVPPDIEPPSGASKDRLPPAPDFLRRP